MNDIAETSNFQETNHSQTTQLPPDDLFIYTGKITEKPVDFLNHIFRMAVERQAADIHFQQTDKSCRVRFRIGGKLTDIDTVSLEWMKTIDDKIRSRAQMSTTDRRAAQDGRIGLMIDGINIDVRVAITRGVGEGQLIVCRLLNQKNSKIRLKDIEMTTSARESFMRLIEEPDGLFLITGPTGSGKTTTLYALLNELNDESRNIITIEQPVEYQIAEFHQINVDGQAITFPGSLRAILRQDPDVIMLGEIRDPETASIAVQAALTGHLVLATLHANTAPLAITRMINYGVDALTLAAALRGVTAQRLVKKLSPDAKVEYEAPNDVEKAWLRAHGVSRKEPVYPKASRDAQNYSGVMPIMEIVVTDHRVKKALLHGEAAIYEAAARQPQFETLAHAAERVALAGITTLKEACSVASAQEAHLIRNKRLGQVLVLHNVISDEDMDALLAEQAAARINGNHKKIGELLIEHGYCTHESLIDDIGYTAEAQDILGTICRTDERREHLANLISKWSPGLESLFALAIQAKLVNEEDIENAVDNY